MKLPPRLPLVSDEIAGPEKVRGVYRTQNRRRLIVAPLSPVTRKTGVWISPLLPPP